jgi:DNA polymerase-1
MLKIAMIDIDLAFQRKPLAAMLLQVHDELLFEAKLENVEDAKLIIENRMISAVPLEVPILVEAKTGISWDQCH